MLETIRQYAREKLMEAGEVVALRDRHFDYYLRLSDEAESELRGSKLAWLDRLARDYENLGIAIDWGQGGRPEDTLRLMGNLIFFWAFGVNGYQQAIGWLKGLLSKVEPPIERGPASERRLLARARGLTTLGLLNMVQGDPPAATAAFTDAIHLERALGDAFYLALGLAARAALAMQAGDTAAGRPAAEEATTLMRSLNDKQWLIICLTFLAAIESREGHQDKAERLRQEANLYLNQADHPIFTWAFISLGEDARERNELDEARLYFEKGLAIARQLNSRPYITLMESELAHVARKRGQLAEAKVAYRRLINIWKEFGKFSAVAHQLESFGYVALAEHELLRATRLLAAAEILRDNIHIPMTDVEHVEYDAAVATVRGQMGADALAAAWAEGRAMDMERAIQYAVTAADPAEPASKP